MLRGFAAVALLLVCALAAHAGTPDDPELTDPAADQAVTRGPAVLPPNEDAFDDVDIRSAWMRQEGGQILVSVGMSAPPQGATVHVSVMATPTGSSVPSSGARGNATKEAAAEGDVWRASFALADLGASPGDAVHITSITARRTNTGDLPQDVVTEDDQTGTDEGGPGRPLVLQRPPMQGKATLTVLGGTADGVPFDGPRAPPHNGTVMFRLQLSNDGIDPDTFHATTDLGAVSPASIALEPGETGIFQVTVIGTTPGLTEVSPEITSTLGFTATVTLIVDVPIPATPETRNVVPSGLSFLSSLAVGIGLDEAFGAYAELAVAAVGILVAILIVWLAVSLAPSPWARHLERPPPSAPRTAVDQGPGIHRGGQSSRQGEARKTASKLVPKATVTGQRPPEDDRRAALASELRNAPPAGRRPTDAAVIVTPVRDARGRLDAVLERQPTNEATPRVTHVRVQDIRHEPADAAPGDTVTTRLRAHNAGASAKIRFLVTVAGRSRAQERVTLAGGETQEVVLRWTAGGPGAPTVEVQEA